MTEARHKQRWCALKREKPPEMTNIRLKGGLFCKILIFVVRFWLKDGNPSYNDGFPFFFMPYFSILYCRDVRGI